MANVPKVCLPIARFFGPSVAEDGCVLVGYEMTNGAMEVLSIPPKALTEAIATFVEATSVFPAPDEIDTRQALLTASAEFDTDDDDGSYFLTLELARGGHLTFAMDDAIAEQLFTQLKDKVWARFTNGSRPN